MKKSGLPEVINGERRTEERIPVNDIPVEIMGTDRAGQHFNERAAVKSVTDRGCRFDTRAQLRCGDIVAVKPFELSEKVLKEVQSQLFEVMWAANHGTKCTVGTRGFKVKNLQTPNLSHPMTLRESPRNNLPKTHSRRASPNSGQRGASFLCFLALQPHSSVLHRLTRPANDYFPFRGAELAESLRLRLRIPPNFLTDG